ncbi:MAG TPA: 3',5'-cyclic-nucleotide phosphodiesterase [Hymenobacter sp.]|uniref:3',5'-cyclic-nucleotide phosphodiesterase n=1 Tax=Hymenobacter sp. TaxID=1898978 RepID=UPI002ED92679
MFCLVALNWALVPCAWGQQAQGPAFTVVPLGVQGGLAEGNLSAYLVAPVGSTAFVCLDAGSLHTGIEKAIANRAFKVSSDEVLKQYIKAYCISHPHLDHVAGLLLNAPDDSAKPIYGLRECVATLQSEYFNWRAWPNFGNAGTPPALNKYQLQTLTPRQETPIPNTRMSVQAFVLSHSKPYQSTAFLVRSQGSYLLYLGDTGADSVEKTPALRALWQAVQPIVQRGQLKAIFIEASYDNSQPLQQLFGHLTPALLMQEMAVLAKLTGAAALRGLPVVITHTKPTLRNADVLKQQLAKANALQLKLVFPEQGRPLQF